MAPWWQQHGNSDWLAQRRRLLTLLEQQAKLERMVRIVGKDALPVQQQLTLLCADLVSEAILRQSAMSTVDRYCSPERQAAMMQLLTRFIELSEQAIEQRVDFELIGNLPILRRLRRMSEEIGEHDMDKFETLRTELEQVFSTLAKQEPANAG